MTLANPKADAIETLIARHAAPDIAVAWAETARGAAFSRLREMGAPGRRDEYWKFTDPGRLTAPDAAAYAPVDGDEVAIFSDVDRLELVFVDGKFSADQSGDLELSGLTIEPLSNAMAQDIHWASDLYGALETNGQNPVSRPFAALNTAVATQGFAIRVSGKPAKPVAFRYVRTGATPDAAIHHVIKIDAGAEFTVLEDGTAASRYNNCIEVDVADNAGFHHIRAQGRDHDRLAMTHMFARLGTESSFKSFTLSVNGALTRNECVIELTGDDASAHIAGAAAGHDDFHHDDTVFITHDAVNCESRQVFKKVLRNGAVGVFQGKILVKAGAQKTDGYQISQGLMLDDDSQFLAKPELEIYADDVACSHGSTVGAVDEEALFYLTSRGVPRHKAQELLLLAFLDEAIAEIADEDLANIIRDRLAVWLMRKGD